MKQTLIELLKIEGVNSKKQVLEILEQDNIEVVDRAPQKIITDENKNLCPNCEEFINYNYNRYNPPFCRHCGQALDYEVEK